MTIMSEDQESSNSFKVLKNKIIESIINERNAFFIHQQINDPDLSLNERRIIVENLLHSNKSLFLQRYGQYLDAKALTFFSNDNCEEVQIQLGILQAKIKSKNKLLRNRRFQALQDLLKEGTYFSNTEIQSRNPYLFEQMIGRYMNEQERREFQNSNYHQNYDQIGFSSYLLETARQVYLENRIVQTKESQYIDDSSGDDSEEINDEKKDSLRQEFLKIMIENFLAGEDREYFNYEKVDNNEEYDLSREFEYDQEDRYFEEE